MGCEYFVYAEGKDKNSDEWLLLDGYYKNLKSGEFELCPAYSCYSRSSFGEAYDELYRQSYRIVERELSKGLQDKFKADDERYSDSDFENWKRDLIAYDFRNMLNLIGENRFTHHGFIHKDVWQEYLTDGLWDLYEDEEESFLGYTPEERKKLFEYHEWDNYDDWLYHFKLIKDGVLKHESDFLTVNYMANIDDIRIIIYRC